MSSTGANTDLIKPVRYPDVTNSRTVMFSVILLGCGETLIKIQTCPILNSLKNEMIE